MIVYADDTKPYCNINETTMEGIINISQSEKQYRRKRITPVLTIGKLSERCGQRLAIPLPGEKKLIDDC